MRIVPRREMLEYLDSIGVTPPMIATTANKASGTPTPSSVSKKSRRRGCLLLLLVPPLLAASVALLRMLALFFVVLGLLNPTNLLIAQVTDLPPVVPHSIAETVEPEQPPQPTPKLESDENMLFRMLPKQDELRKKSAVVVGSSIVELDTTAIPSTQTASSAPQHPAGQSNDENASMAGMPNRDIGSIQPNHAPDAFNGRSAIVPKAILLPSIDEPSRQVTNSFSTPPDWRVRTVTLPWYLEPRILGVLLVSIAFLLLAYCSYSERASIKSQLRAPSRQPVVNQDNKQHQRPTQRYYRENLSEKPRSIREVDIKPNCETSTWRIGVASIPGNVRSENQDSVTVFEFQGVQVLLVADGCGGVPHGAAASRLAIEACAKEIMWSIVSGTTDMEIVIERGFASASEALEGKGKELGLNTLEGGLRTTLIVAIGTKSEFYWGYIGDGALKVIDSSGQKRECMVAHRSDAAVTNVLNASLGPTFHGLPEFGRMPRNFGDVLLAGTDGVFDRVDDRFTRDLMRMAIFHQGNLTQAILASLEQLASVSDSTGGFVCDDNLSLGILADGHRPSFQPEFWNAKVLNT